MTAETSEAPRPGAERLAWREFTGKRAVIRALEGSYAARHAQAALREADGAIELLERLLEPQRPPTEQPIEIYLVDPVMELPPGIDQSTEAAASSVELPEGRASSAIVRVIRPEAPNARIAWSLAHLLIPRWFGAGIASSPLFLDGIGGFIAARSGAGPTLDETFNVVQAEIEAGRSVSIFTAAPSPRGTDAERAAWDSTATTFVAYLIETFGPAALRRFVASYDPERRDQAAVAAYQRPLGSLEEAWRGAVARRRAQAGALSTLFGYLKPLLRPYWKREIEVLVLMLLGITYSLTIPLSGKYLVDTVIPSRHVHDLVRFILVLVVIYVLNTLIGVRRAYVNNWINQRVLLELQERMFVHLLRLSHNFYGTAKVGDIITRMSGDLQIIQQAMGQVAGVGIYQALVAIAAAVTILILNPLLGLLILLVLPLFLLSYLLLAKRLSTTSRERQKLTGEVAATTEEHLAAHAVVKAFGLEQRSQASYHTRLMLLLHQTLRLVIFGSLFEISTALAVTMGQIVVLGVGGYMVIEGNMTIGTLLASIGLLPSLFSPVSALLQVLETVQSAAGSVERITELLDEPIAVADTAEAIVLPAVSREIRLDHVTFSYGGDRSVIRDLSLAITAGTHVAIVGPSGSGKSTIVNLLLRFWDPEKGSVLYDGHDLRQVKIDSLRGQIGTVFQDTFIFDTTLRENIAIGRPTASDAEIVAAVKAAQLESYVETLPNGYDTVLGERGVLMSGGQRQRLSIARALLRDPRILILDEATSALDATTEREILQTLAVLARGRTTISITHRLSLAALADQVVVLDKGQVVERGTHAELARAGGLYQQLYEEQTGHVTTEVRVRSGVDPGRLRAIPLLGNLSGETLAAVADRLMPERYAAGEVVVRQHEPGDKLFIVGRGAVEIVVKDGAGERRINTLTEGEYFGEMALLEEKPRVATVRTIMPSELYSLSRGDFLALLESVPDIRASVDTVVAVRRQALVSATHGAPATAMLPA